MALVVLRVKGTVNVPHWARYTLNSLNLYKKYWATILPETPESLGMLKKIKDFVAWTHVDAGFVKDLLERRGKANGSKPSRDLPKTDTYSTIDELALDIANDKVRFSSQHMIKPWFSLSPPRGGFKRKTKTQYNQKGMLGEHKELADIIRRMI